MNQNKIDKLLYELSKVNDEKKGEIGENLAFEVLKKYKNKKKGSVLITSLTYPYCSNVPGNLKLINNRLKYFSDTETDDEVDLVLITPFRIFLCEVKAYRYKIELTNEWTFRSKGAIEKSIPTQAEKHARHFYYNYYDIIPNGKSDYIIPLIIIADKSEILDRRDKFWREYVPITNINHLNKTISIFDKPLEYKLDVKKILEVLKKRSTSIGTISI